MIIKFKSNKKVIEMNSLSIVILFITAVLVISCDTIDPFEIENINITLTAEDASCTEAWLRLTSENISFPYEAILSVDIKKFNLTINQADTILYIDSLLPNRNYEINLSNIKPYGLPVQESSAFTQVTTIDTTSHNFTWQKWEFGDFGSSMINDVAIIDGNNIWAVGEIHINDSLGNPDTKIYNAVHWNGTDWELKRITVNFRGSLVVPPLDGILTFSPTDIWVIGSLPIHGDGQNWTVYDLRKSLDPNISVSRAWGTNTNDMYFVGRNGSIVHYNGSWQKIESGTNNTITDIWGYTEGGQKEIYCISQSYTNYSENKILKIKDNMITDSIKININRVFSSVWMLNKNKIYLGTNGIYENKMNDWLPLNQIPPKYITKIRGIEMNDIFASGVRGLITHFNGSSWKVYSEIEPLERIDFYSVSIKHNTVILVGLISGVRIKSIIAKGQR